MAVQVNPPPLLKIPRAFINDPEVRTFIEQQNVIIFQLWNRTGGATDIPGDNAEDIANNTLAIIANAEQIAINVDDIADNAALIEENKQAINEIPVFSGFMAQLQFIQRQVDGLPEFTIDTSGFTTDLTFITTDKVIA